VSAPPIPEGAGLRLLARAARPGAAGILNAARGKHKRLICVDEGRVVFVASNMVEEQFDEELVRQDLLGLAQRAEARAVAAEENKKLTAVLVERELAQPAVLARAHEDYVRNLLVSTLEWFDAQFQFEKGKPNLAGELLVDISIVEFILDYVRTHPADLDEVRVRIGRPDLRPVTTRQTTRMVADVTLGEAAYSMLEGCDGRRDISALLAQSKYPIEEVLRPLYGFFLLGIVEEAKEDEEAAKKVRDQVGREEVLARLHQAEKADHYLVLGVDAKASEAQIRDGYYLLARRYHPDRFSTGPLADLRYRIEGFFAKVTEAYNTLSDPELRAQYDEELASKVVKKQEPEQDKAYLARENFAKAKILLEKKRYQDAVTFLENAVQLDNTKSEYHLELGRVLIRNPRRRKDAEQYLKRATTLNPTSVRGFMALGQLYGKMGRNHEAARAFGEVLRWEPNNAEAKRELKNLG
jgi:curved DNA-binding protein CbpA